LQVRLGACPRGESLKCAPFEKSPAGSAKANGSSDARWYITKPKFAVLVYFQRPWYGKF